MNKEYLKGLTTKKLRILRDDVKKELDFRYDVGSEMGNMEKGVWMSANEWGKRVQELLKEEQERG